MAVTENLHTGNGSKTNYSFTFPYLKTTDIKASVDGTVVTNFTAGSPTATEIQFNTAPANNAAIRIYRDTATDNLSATFYAGSAIKSEDLNDNFLQNLYVTQEAKRDADAAWQDGDETINSSETWHTSDDTKVATTKAIENRVTNKIKTALTGDVEGGQSITVTDNSPSDGKITVAVTAASIGTTQLANDAVNGDKIADNAINSEHYTDGSIDNEHLADDAVGIDELGPNAVVNASVKSDAAIEFTKLENLDSAKILVGNGTNKATEVSMSGDVAISNTGATTIQAGAVERAMLAADVIDGTKIDDDAVDSDHIAAGAIDTEHIGAAQVTLAKTADLADTKIIVGNGSNRPTAVSVSGDTTIANTGAVTIANNAITTAKINNDAVTTAKIADAELKTLAGMPTATASVLADTTALTASTAELNLLDNKSFKDSSAGTLNTTSDTEIPSSKVIAAHVASSQTAIGGFVTIADEVSFPATASMPANGVVVSINNAAGIVVSGSSPYTSTTGRTTDGTPATVTINNFPSSLAGETLAAGVGLIVTATSTSNTYNYHKILAAETDVKQLSDDINDFNARYRVAGSAPGSNNDAGDMYFDTAANKMKVYNGTTSTWDDVASVGNFYINTISSSSGTGGGSATFNGSAYRFQLSNAPTMAQQLIVSINGVIQKPNAGTSQPSEGFAISGNDIIFSAAPAAGSDYFIVTQGSSVSIGTPSDNTVSTAKIQNQAVSDAKILDNSIEEQSLKIHNTPSTGKLLKYTSNGMEWGDGAYLPLIGGIITGDTVIEGTNVELNIRDGVKAAFGTGHDFNIWHDGSGKTNFDGDVRFLGQGQNINWSKSDNLLWFQTNTNSGQSAKTWWGDGSSYGNLEIFKSASGPAIIQTSNSDLQIATGNSADINLLSSKDINFINSTGTTNYYMRCKENSGSDQCVELYYGNTPTKRLETTATGINVTGQINVNGAELSAAPTIEAVANGAIAANEAVIIEATGKVAGVTGFAESLSSASDGTQSTSSGNKGPRYLSSAWDSANSTMVHIFEQLSGSSNGSIVAVAATLSGSTWTWGSPTQIATGESAWPKITSLGGNKYFAIYSLSSSSKGVVLSVSGTTITVGTASEFYNDSSSWCDMTIANTNKVVICWGRTSPQYYSYARAATVSGTTITWGTTSNSLNGTGDHTNSWLSSPTISKIDTDKVLVNGYGSPSSTAYFYVITVSGTNLSVNEISHSNFNRGSRSIWDSNNNAGVAVTYDSADSNKVKALKFTVSGSSLTVDSSSLTTIFTGEHTGDFALGYSSNGTILLGYIPTSGGSSNGDVDIVKLDISGSTVATSSLSQNISDGDGNERESDYGDISLSIVPISDAKFAVSYGTESGGGYRIKTKIKQFPATDMTTENFIGFSSAAYSDGNTAKINVVGNTTTQSSLTPGQKYYVTNSGGLSTTAANPSVEAGTALSSTKLLIKG